MGTGNLSKTRETAATSPERFLGHRPASTSAPFLLACAGVHGDEHAGVHAVQHVLDDVDRNGHDPHAEFLGVAGNLAALAARQRWLDFDLNRVWTHVEVERLRAGRAAGAEAQEQWALLEIFEQAREHAGTRLHVVDLHTTSAPSPAFALTTRRDLAFASLFGLPIVLGLEQWIHGTVLHYFVERDHPCVVIEAGQHTDPRSVDVHRSTLQRALGLQAMAPPPFILEAFHAEPLDPGARFELRADLRGFEAVESGETIGWADGEPLTAPAAGTLVMPLAKPHGDHAFFLARAA